MILQVRLYATLRQYAPDSPHGALTVELPDGATISEIFDALAIPAEEVRLVMVNGVDREFDTVLSPQDRVGIFPPVGGG